jgi:EmrB/QacA subfamily drug resistance transporter
VQIHPRRSPRRLALIVSCLAVALVLGSMVALYTALPEIAVATGASQFQLTWVVDSYTLAVACLVLPAGAIGDRHGRRGVLIGGLAVFAAASVAPLFIDDPWWLIAARTVAGIGAAFVLPSTLSLLTENADAPARRRAAGIWAAVAASGAVIGVLFSGALLEFFSWRAIFVALAVAGAVLAIAACGIPPSRDRRRPAIDMPGSLAVAAAVGLFVAGLIEAPARGWTAPLVLALFGGAAIGLGLFALVEFRVGHPLIDLRLFADRAFAAGTVSLILHFLVIFGAFLLLTQYLQLIRGYSTMVVALALTPLIVPIVLVSLGAPQWAARFGLRRLLVAGLAALSAGSLLLGSLTPGTGYPVIVWSLLVLGVGLGLCSAPSTAAIVDATPPEKHGVAAAINDAAREVGAAIGIAIAGSVLAAGYSHHVAAVADALAPPVREAFDDSLAAAVHVQADGAGVSDAALSGAKAAFVHGCTTAALVLGIISAVSACAVAVWAPARVRAASPQDASRSRTT